MKLTPVSLVLLVSLFLGLGMAIPTRAFAALPLSDLVFAAYNGKLIEVTPLTIAFPTPVPIKKNASFQIRKTAVRSSDFDPLFDKYASQFNIPVATMKKIAYCESKYNPQAVSRSGAYVGLFQFAEKTWVANRNVMGLDPNPTLRTDPEQAIMTAAFKIASGGIKAWPVCSAI